jgi:dolichyl-phosphate beta-glucosyltransferase
VTAQRLSIVVPARNEEERLPVLLDALANGGGETLRRAGLDLVEVIVVDDGSTDGTAALVERRAQRDARLRLIRLDPGEGKGGAVRAGMLAASAPWALVTDADLSTPLAEAGRLADAVRSGADVAIGSRGLAASSIRVHQPRYRELAGKIFNVGVRLATGLPFRDTQCGFKLFRLASTRVLFARQTLSGFAFDVEILLAAAHRGLRIAEVPVEWANVRDTRVRFADASVRMSLDLARVTARYGRADGSAHVGRERPAHAAHVRHAGLGQQ